MGSPKDFWDKFGEAITFDESCSQIGVAGQVLDSVGINHSGVTGGAITNLDIKSMDAMQAIKLSLAEFSADNGGLWEISVDTNGTVYMYDVGRASGMSGGEIYSTIQTYSYVSRVAGVMITGAKPPIKRKTVSWKSIFAGGVEIFNTGWLIGGCNKSEFSKFYTIVYSDPHMTTGTESFGNGIDDFYESKTPWESILGYARYTSFPGYENSPDTKITFSQTATVPILVSDGTLGTLVVRPKIAKMEDVSEKCFEGTGTEADPQHGIKIEIPSSLRYTTIRGTKIDGFVKVSKIYIVGKAIRYRAIPFTSADAINTTAEGKVELEVNVVLDLIYDLELGKHYQIAYQDGEPYVVFADNSHPDDATVYGSNMTYVLHPQCKAYQSSQNNILVGNILPTSEQSGYLVSQVFAAVELNANCVTVYDPEEGEAKRISELLDYQATPLILIDEPSPVAINGNLIDLTSTMVDHDPTTSQDFINSEYEQAILSMDGGLGYSLSMSFLTAEQAANLSGELYNQMNNDSGMITVSICSPDTEATIGGEAVDGSIVNEIVYSYSDSNSYTISVASGPRIIKDFASIGSGPTYKATEGVSNMGTITEDAGNHINFKVIVDGVGPVNAINGTSDILRVGDKVQCTMYNNPVEV